MNTPVDDLLELLNVPGVSTEEAKVADKIEQLLLACGVPEQAILRDRAFEGSQYGGNCGNLIVRFPAVGDQAGPACLFSAHMDTVALAKGCRPRLMDPQDPSGKGGRIVNDAPHSALGGDDRTGCAVLLHVARALAGHRSTMPRPPVTLLFSVQEELGLVGTRELDVKALGFDGPAFGFNFDGGRVDEIVTRVTGTWRFEINIRGIAAHAGADPASGVSAAVVAAKAIAALERQGWHGLIQCDQHRGSANIGTIHGGQGTNVVMDRLTILAEVRSHDAEFRTRLVQIYEEQFKQAAATVNSQGRSAEVSFAPGPRYESFALPDNEPVVRTSLAAARQSGLDPRLVSNNGGMDANWLNAHGIPTVTFGLGQHAGHAPDEWIDLDQFHAACRLALALL